jgi:hypothetical protein
MRSESCTFIWQPKVRTSYVRGFWVLGSGAAAAWALAVDPVEGLVPEKGEGMVKLTC